MELNTIKLIACDIDGVLVVDTFSPVLHKAVEHFGGEYNRELERRVFSRSRNEVGEYLQKVLNLSDIGIYADFFWKERENFIKKYDTCIIEGVLEFLEFISTLNVKLVCYGGLSEDKIIDEFKQYMHFFDQYVCTNDFRPGIKEITRDIYGLDFNQVLFIDDVNTVAEVARAFNVPFIGIPSDYKYGFQRQDMIDTKVKYILNSVKDIDESLLKKIDNEAALENYMGIREKV